jgi:hypothetical protein
LRAWQAIPTSIPARRSPTRAAAALVVKPMAKSAPRPLARPSAVAEPGAKSKRDQQRAQRPEPRRSQRRDRSRQRHWPPAHSHSLDMPCNAPQLATKCASTAASRSPKRSARAPATAGLRPLPANHQRAARRAPLRRRNRCTEPRDVNTDIESTFEQASSRLPGRHHPVQDRSHRRGRSHQW